MPSIAPPYTIYTRIGTLASPLGRGGNAAGIDGEGDVGGGVPDAPPYITHARIGATLPLPSGEVAAA